MGQNECIVQFTHKNRELGNPLERTTYHPNLLLPFEYNAIKQTKKYFKEMHLFWFLTERSVCDDMLIISNC